MSRKLKLAALVSVLLVCVGLAYGEIRSTADHNSACGKTSAVASTDAPPGPDPCARSASDWRVATFAFLLPGLAGLIGTAAGAVVASIGTPPRAR